MPTKTNRPKIYACSYPDCKKAYSRPVLLRQHENSHKNERPFKCLEPDCDKAFFKKSNLQDHSYSHRPMSERPFACSLCEMRFISLDRLRRHELTHVSDRYKCTREGCTRAFASYQGLKHHIATFHDRVLNCDICNKFFQLPRLVKEHRIRNHSEVPTNACPMLGCHSIFADKSELDWHMSKYHPELVCNTCGEKFVGEKALNVHISVHHQMNYPSLWRCSLCCNNFVTETDLNNHSLTVHGHEPSPEATENPLDRYLIETDSPSLQTMLRRNAHQADIIPDESQVIKKRGRTKTSRSLPLADLRSSVIGVVSQRPQTVHVCPYKSCQKKYVRLHFYEKHLIRHKDMIDLEEHRNE